MNLNKAFILGNLTRDPEKRNLPSGQPVVSFGLATNRFYKDQQGTRQQDTEFHNITIFGKMAETAAKYLQKGSMVFIEGRIKTRNWLDASGVKHYRTEIIAENMQLGPRLAGQGQPTYFKQTGQKDNNKNIPATEDIPIIEEPTEEIDVKEIPF